MGSRARLLIPALAAALAVAAPARAERAVQAPAPLVDAAPTRALETAVFAGGCYWGVERLFWQQDGVWLTEVGFAGGTTENPTLARTAAPTTAAVP